MKHYKYNKHTSPTSATETTRPHMPLTGDVSKWLLNPSEEAEPLCSVYTSAPLRLHSRRLFHVCCFHALSGAIGGAGWGTKSQFGSGRGGWGHAFSPHPDTGLRATTHISPLLSGRLPKRSEENIFITNHLWAQPNTGLQKKLKKNTMARLTFHTLIGLLGPKKKKKKKISKES